MGLVGYSDSEGEGSEDETTPITAPSTIKPATAPHTTKPATRTIKPGFQKVVDTTAGTRKIKVDLPSAKLESHGDDERPAKKPRTAGLGGFNSFLPAPKRTAEQKKPGLGAGVNLRTGAEPAFSRERVEPDYPAPSHTPAGQAVKEGDSAEQETQPKEVKIVGNAMRFKPLSVANKKQKKKPTIPPPSTSSTQTTTSTPTTTTPAPAAAPPPKPKVSLFSLAEPSDPTTTTSKLSDYNPLLTTPIPSTQTSFPTSTTPPPEPTPQNPLDALADSLNLPPSARRQLLGRRGGNGPATANIKHFDTETEYNANERFRQEGQAQEHRAVKAVAPGKHSLQQLVNAAASQKEALEDKWAEGKRNKSEAGGRYGW